MLRTSCELPLALLPLPLGRRGLAPLAFFAGDGGGESVLRLEVGGACASGLAAPVRSGSSSPESCMSPHRVFERGMSGAAAATARTGGPGEPRCRLRPVPLTGVNGASCTDALASCGRMLNLARWKERSRQPRARGRSTRARYGHAAHGAPARPRHSRCAPARSHARAQHTALRAPGNALARRKQRGETLQAPPRSRRGAVAHTRAAHCAQAGRSLARTRRTAPAHARHASRCPHPLLR